MEPRRILFAPDATSTTCPLPRRAWSAGRAAFPDSPVIVEDAITQGDRAMVRLAADGTPESDLSG